MSDYYYEQQRIEDILSLQAMFGPPWTEELLGDVLDHYGGDMDETINKLLVLEGHHNGNPEPLVEKLIMSGYQYGDRDHYHGDGGQFGGGGGDFDDFRGGTVAAIPPPLVNNPRPTKPRPPKPTPIPKSKLKKAPPPRKVKVDVKTTDGKLTNTTITISKSTRRRVGLKIRLEDDFLRIPKLPKKPKKPLFDPKTLNKLHDMNPDLLPPSNPKSSPTVIIADPLPRQQQQQQQQQQQPQPSAASTAFQSIRDSIKISFPSTTKSTPEKGTATLTRQRRANSQDSAGSGTGSGGGAVTSNSTLLGRIKDVKITAPTMNLPKAPSMNLPKAPTLNLNTMNMPKMQIPQFQMTPRRNSTKQQQQQQQPKTPPLAAFGHSNPSSLSPPPTNSPPPMGAFPTPIGIGIGGGGSTSSNNPHSNIQQHPRAVSLPPEPQESESYDDDDDEGEDLFVNANEDGKWGISAIPASKSGGGGPATTATNNNKEAPTSLTTSTKSDPGVSSPAAAASSWGLSIGGGSYIRRGSRNANATNNNSTESPADTSSTLTTSTKSDPGRGGVPASWGLSIPSLRGSSTTNNNNNKKQPPPPTTTTSTTSSTRSNEETGGGSRWSSRLVSFGTNKNSIDDAADNRTTTTTTTVRSTNDEIDNNSNTSDDVIDTYGSIPQLEFRGMTVQQLQQLLEEIRQRCVEEQWKSVETGRLLQPHQVSMYDVARYHIIPKTQQHRCSYVEQSYGKYYLENGLPRPPQWFVSHTWNDSVFDLVQCIQQHDADRHGSSSSSATSARGGNLLLHNNNNNNNNDDDVGMYWICAFAMNQHRLGAHVVADLDRLSDDSLLQDPRLTQKVLQVTQGMLVVIDNRGYYYSRIWCLWELFLALERRKVSSTVATVGDAEDHYLLDVYAVNDDGIAVGLTSGFAEADKHRSSSSTTTKAEHGGGGDKDNNNNSSNDRPTTTTAIGQLIHKQQPCHQSEWSELRTMRESLFRFQSCEAALDVNLETTHASLEEDTRRIMNYIVQNKRDDNPNEAEALTVHPAYAHVNALVRGTFAGLCYRKALEDSAAASGRQDDELNSLSLKKVQTELSASRITHLEVNFAGCIAFQIREALKFVESLPSSLQHLDLDYSFLDFQYAEEFAIGFSRLSENLETLKLNLSFCSKLDNLDRLWEELGNLVNLRFLRLVVHPNRNLTSVDGLAAALSKLPHLECLQLEFDCFGEYSKLVAMAKGGATLNNISSTYRNMLGGKSSVSSSDPTKNELAHQFDKVSKLSNSDLGGAYIDDSSIQRLCRGLTSRNQLTSLRLRFLGDFGKKLKGVESAEDLRKKLQQVRKGLKLFS